MPNEVILDSSAGLNWPTLCKRDLLHLVAKAELKTRRGKVGDERRRQIIALRGWHIPFGKIGREVSHLGIEDPDIIPLLDLQHVAWPAKV